MRIQDELVLEDFGITTESAGTAVGVVKTFRDIPLTDRLTVELVPKNDGTTAAKFAPMLCGLEVIDESGK